MRNPIAHNSHMPLVVYQEWHLFEPSSDVIRRMTQQDGRKGGTASSGGATAPDRTSIQWDISLKNEGSTSNGKAESNAITDCVVFCGGLLMVSEITRDRAKDKGEDCGRALWLTAWNCFEDIQSAHILTGYFPPFNCLASFCAMPTSSWRRSPACAPISPIRSSASSAPLRLVKSFSSPLSLSWRRAISPLTAVTINCARDSFFSKDESISLTTSCGNRALICCDLLFMALVISLYPLGCCAIQYSTKMNTKNNLNCDSFLNELHTKKGINCDSAVETAKPGSASTLTGPLNPVKALQAVRDKIHAAKESKK